MQSASSDKNDLDSNVYQIYLQHIINFAPTVISAEFQQNEVLFSAQHPVW